MLRVTRWQSTLAGTLLLLSSCAGGGANDSKGTDAGSACHDYVTSDGFTCCCGSTFCTRVPGCLRGTDAGGHDASRGAAPMVDGALVAPRSIPWSYGDGGIPRSVA